MRFDMVSHTPPRVATLFTNNLAKMIEKISKIAERDQKRLRPEDTSIITAALQDLAIATSGLHRLYEGPGKGRHNNDYANIKEISIEPTHEELMCEKVR
jgi:hypothetical protein